MLLVACRTGRTVVAWFLVSGLRSQSQPISSQKGCFVLLCFFGGGCFCALPLVAFDWTGWLAVAIFRPCRAVCTTVCTRTLPLFFGWCDGAIRAMASLA